MHVKPFKRTHCPFTDVIRNQLSIGIEHLYITPVSQFVRNSRIIGEESVRTVSRKLLDVKHIDEQAVQLFVISLENSVEASSTSK